MNNTIRAKFKVDSKEETLYPKYNSNETYEGMSKLVTIKMTPVFRTHIKNEKNEWIMSESENTKFWTATPTGKLELGFVNLETANAFELGKEYYLDFTPTN